jgi:hypothetical protein
VATAIEDASTALDSLGEAILACTNDERPFNEIWGWNCPALTRHDIADIAFRTASRVRSFDGEKLDSEDREILLAVPERVDFLKANAFPQLPSGNSGIVVSSIEQFCAWIVGSLPPQPPSKVTVDWKDALDKKLLPTDLSRRLRSVDASLKKMEPRSAALGEQIQTIADAHSTAENLPALLDDLEEARKQIADADTFVEKSTETIKHQMKDAEASLQQIKKRDNEASALLSNLGEAYRATTTKGLAASFANKALTLNITVYIWTAALAGALLIGAIIAHSSVESVKVLLADNRASTERLLIQLFLTLAGIGGPIWFAWVATKQIGQRFRLAEDYGFKASVAKAYEGYKLEAVRLDENFEKRLFASALTRLEEAPLRLIETETHGSPWHELIRSTGFRRALETVPELKNELTGILAAMPAAVVETVAKRKLPTKKRGAAANESGEEATDAA